MKVHLVGGFLGSGKTTGITRCSQLLVHAGARVAIITNDQGEYLVDSRFVAHSDIPFAEVTGGCFCCHYDRLDSQILELKNRINPSVIFAEAVGSCTDLVATVLKPLLLYQKGSIEQITFSSFADARLLLTYLEGKEMPFKTETNYIWEKQLEEAEILVINKIDLLPLPALKRLREAAQNAYPNKQLLYQNSLEDSSILEWLNLLQVPEKHKKHLSVDIDYQTYGAGEANLAWLDDELEITTTDASAVEQSARFIRELVRRISEKKWPIGHLKFLLLAAGRSLKLSYTAIFKLEVPIPATMGRSHSATLLVNARVQAAPDELRQLFGAVLNDVRAGEAVMIEEKNLSFFQPGYPLPTYRLP